MNSFTAIEIGQLCSDNQAAAHQISQHILWDFEQWRTKLQEHINKPRAQDYVPNVEQRLIERVDNLRLSDFITDKSIHSVDAAAIIALTEQTHVLEHLVNWLATLISGEQRFADDVVLRWCNCNSLSPSLGLSTPTQNTSARVIAIDAKPQVSKGTAKQWTDERKAEVRDYRAKHGLKKTAEHYGVSQATISKHVPAEKAKDEMWARLVKK